MNSNLVQCDIVSFTRPSSDLDLFSPPFSVLQPDKNEPWPIRTVWRRGSTRVGLAGLAIAQRQKSGLPRSTVLLRLDTGIVDETVASLFAQRPTRRLVERLPVARAALQIGRATICRSILGRCRVFVRLVCFVSPGVDPCPETDAAVVHLLVRRTAGTHAAPAKIRAATGADLVVVILIPAVGRAILPACARVWRRSLGQRLPRRRRC